jgi:glycosyltransferase involved in cell wall biosynthesis
MDYHANIDAAVFFAREVWPKLAERVPDAVFTIVGRKPSDAVRALAAGERIEVTGTVDDVRPFYREAWVAVAPLRVGGGTRLKILEAMAAGVPVVSTGLGAEGLHAEPNRDYLLADTAGALVEAIAGLAGDAAKRTALIRAGRDLVERQYDWAALGDALAGHLLQLASESAKGHRLME